MTWNKNSQTLNLNNIDSFIVDNNINLPNQTSKATIFIAYNNEWGNGGFWPSFDLYSDTTGTISKKVEGLGDTYKLVPIVWNLRLYLDGECIAQSIEGAVGDIITLENGSDPRR